MELPMNIREFLPHREPMLMVDEIVKLNGDFIETTFNIKECNIFLDNNFLSEVGIIENAAQTSSGIVGGPHFEKNKLNKEYRVLGYISKIKSVKIFKLPSVNSQLITKGEMVSMHKIGDFYNCDMKCYTYLNDERIAENYFNLIIQPDIL
ncbi:MAG TPA: hypothetical protein VKY37_13225 [Brumimicrobium sp.]|nr:hypothetical protein [Brumimicrobium sp.]